MPFETPDLPSQELTPTDENTVFALKRSIEFLNDKEKLKALERSLGDFTEKDWQQIRRMPLPEWIEPYTPEAVSFRWQKLEEILGSKNTLTGALKAECDELRSRIEKESRLEADKREKAEQVNKIIAQIDSFVAGKAEYVRVVGVDEDSNTEAFDRKIAELQAALEKFEN
jgi:hypothetical protein